MKAVYDTIGVGYVKRRKPDARVAQAIYNALGNAKSVLNVGAGGGSYEPADRWVTALEPSAEMIRQRPRGSAHVCQGVAENIPFPDRQFDAVMAVLTVHHWQDVETGLSEMLRVTRDRLAILTFDPESHYFWLADYIPEIIDLDQPVMPKMTIFERVLGQTSVSCVPVHHDCTDGFLGAYWRRPHAYLDPDVRAAISTFAKLGDISFALKKLKDDLNTGAWEERYGHLLHKESLDVGYRLIVASGA